MAISTRGEVVKVFGERETFAKLLHENEARVYWQSGDMPGAIVHEWRALDDGRLLLKQIDMPHESLYWVGLELVQG